MVDVKNSVSKKEWETRQDLAAFYRTIPYFGWDDLIFTHISAKVPGADDEFLINPYGFLFDEITASNLVKVNLKGKILSDTNNFIILQDLQFIVRYMSQETTRIALFIYIQTMVLQ